LLRNPTPPAYSPYTTKIRLDREGYLYGTVSGSGINWSYWGSKQAE
jgi:NOL1/NOP2/fmu family ribosome biogenesis protein